MLCQLLAFWAILALGQAQSTSPTPASPDAPPATTTNTLPPAVTTTPAPTAGGGGGPTSSPLLFFVALGFGVVFTNLWIIVGVKYCFRYNQRHRQPRAEEVGEPIDMAAMRRPGRRRREKKLMSMEEVNDRFPIVKYKMWRSMRESEGLPTAGGIAPASASRAASLKDAEGTIGSTHNRMSSDNTTELAQTAALSQQEKGVSDITPVAPPDPVTSAAKAEEELKKESAAAETTTTPAATEAATSAAADESPRRNASADEEDDEDDHIHTAVPAELLASPGDSCAICLDTLEDDDDVRGLTCGHAFHASCLDPWLISRRACCPLCKADYYVPKPRPEGEAAAAEAERVHRSRGPTASRRRGPLPALPPAAWTVPRSGNSLGSRLVMPGRFMTGGNGMSENDGHGRHEFRHGWRRRQPAEGPAEVSYTADTDALSTTAQSGQRGRGGPWFSGRLNLFANRRDNMANMREDSEVSYTATTTTTPSSMPARGGEGGTEGGRWRPRVSNPFRTGWMPALRMPGRAEASAADGGAPPGGAHDPTPGQLEAGATRA